jgi:phosphoenolpyruvate carboxykinase (GTP)
VPRVQDLELGGLAVDPERVEAALQVDPAQWRLEVEAQEELFLKHARTMPEALLEQREALRARVSEREAVAEESRPEAAVG